MFLFIISFLLVFISSYFLTSIIAPKKNILGLIYLFLIAFAQIVLTFEVLSLFSAIKAGWVLSLNFVVLILSTYSWRKRNKPMWSLEFKDFRNRVINSFKLDKSLMWLYVGFAAFVMVAFFLCFIMPITSADAMSYHVARSVFWVLQGNLNHFEIADVRILCLPINSEILYSWILLFVKKDVFFGFFSFVGYLLSIISIYNILSLMGYSTRKKLWTVFIFSSFSSVIVQASGTETDIIIAGLISSSIFLFWYGLKNNQKMPVFMASLAYVLAIGTKTTAIIAIPGIGLFMLALCFYFKQYKPLILFLGFGLINFLIFASYNYILNYIHFGNFMGSASLIVTSKNYYGLRGMFSNFIKYIFMLFDFTGFRWAEYVTPTFTSIRNTILHFLHLSYIKDGLYTMPYAVNRLLLEPVMGAGILGFLVYLPTLCFAFLYPIFKIKSKKTWFIFSFALLFIVNLLLMSYLIVYMIFSVRFVMFFMLLSAPILIYSYFPRKNPLKYLIIAFALFYFLGVSTYLWPRPFVKIVNILIKHHSITYLRDLARCKSFDENTSYENSACILRNRIEKSFDKDTKFLIFANTADKIYLIKALGFEGFNIDFGLLENVENIDLNKYNIVISTNRGQLSTLINNYKERKNDYKITNQKIITKKDRKVPCIYIPNFKIADIRNKEVAYPFQVRCGMKKEFLDGNNLEFLGIVGFMESKNTIESFDYYTLYKNTKLPLRIIPYININK
jgi:hypothetical protein